MNPDIIELAGMLFILVLIIAIVQWLLLRFTHWSIALGATAFIALFITFVYVSLSNASPNGSGNGADLSKYVTPMLVVFASLLCGLFVVAYLTKTQLPKKVLLFVSSFIIVFFVVRYVYQYINNATVYQEIFSSCDIKLVNNSDKELVQEIGFKNSSNSLINSINPDIPEQPYSNIPRGADQISFRCSSETQGMFYQDFPFDYNLLQERDGNRLGLCFWLREKVVLPLKIVLQSNDKAQLYINNKLVQQYQLTKEDLSDMGTHKGKYK